MDRKEGGRRVIMGGAEIDTRAPFKSVKEAVMLFGERVLVGEIYANKLKEMRDEAGENGSGEARGGALAMAGELEETKQRLEGAREEANTMAECIKSLKKELEDTKKELEDTKAREMKLLQLQLRKDDPETEEDDFKYIANGMEIRTQTDDDEEEEGTAEYEKRRYVKFASPHVLAQVIPNKEELLGRHIASSAGSVKKKVIKRKPLVPLIGWLFSKKKGSNEIDHSPKA